MTLGQKIKKLRNEKNLTQKDLADQVHVTFQTVSKWENDENEPDVSTLRELAKLFGCSMDFLLSESEEEQKEEKVEEPAAKTIIIHQKELHVCRRCGKDIPEDDLAVEHLTRRVPYGRVYKTEPAGEAYYHKECWEEVVAERAEAERKARAAKLSKAKKICFGWGIAGGVIGFGIALAIFLCNTKYVNPGLGVVFSLLIGYGLFAMIYCILSGSFIGDVFMWCVSRSIRFPGLIFGWSIEGFIWVICMKILFAIIGFLFGLFCLVFGVTLSAALGGISFPFVLIHNINTDYDDAL